MSEHFRKDAPHYEFSTVRIRLDEWLEDRSSGTLFGPKGCGKDTFLKDYFTPKKTGHWLLTRTSRPLCWFGRARLSGTEKTWTTCWPVPFRRDFRT